MGPMQSATIVSALGVCGWGLESQTAVLCIQTIRRIRRDANGKCRARNHACSANTIGCEKFFQNPNRELCQSVDLEEAGGRQRIRMQLGNRKVVSPIPE